MKNVKVKNAEKDILEDANGCKVSMVVEDLTVTICMLLQQPVMITIQSVLNA